MFKHREIKIPQKSTFALSTTKIKNILCVFCQQKFFVRDLNRPKGHAVPLLLSCGHAACNKCVNARWKDSCPRCDSSSKIFNVAEAALSPVNIYVLGLLIGHKEFAPYDDKEDISFFKKDAMATKQIKFEESRCKECETIAALRCYQCAVSFCYPCYTKLHTKFKTLMNHRIISFSNGEMDEFFNIKTCTEHEAVVDYYCKQCSIFSCHHCMLSDHLKHDVVPLTKKNKEFESQFEAVENKVAEKLMQVHQEHKKIEQLLRFPEQLQRSEEVEAAINKHFLHLHGILQGMEKCLIDKLYEHRKQHEKYLNDIRQRLEIQQKRLQNGLIMTGNAKSVINKIDLQEIIPKLENLANTPCHNFEDDVFNTQDITFTCDLSVIPILKDHCKLVIPESPNSYECRENILPEDFTPETPKLDELNELMNDSISSTSSIATRSSFSQSQFFSRRLHFRDLKEGSFGLVEIRYIGNPLNFYVRRVSQRQEIKELKLMLHNYANENIAEPFTVEKNNYYIVQKESNGKWYRGEVLDINCDQSETYEIIDLDNGRIEHKVPVERMRFMSQSLMIIPPTAINCALYDIVPKNGKWVPEAYIAIAQYQEPYGSIMMHIVEIKDNTCYVDLSKEKIENKTLREKSLRDFLIYSGFGIPNPSNQLQASIVQPERKFYHEELIINSYENVIVSHVDSPDCIYVRKGAYHHSYLSEMGEKISSYYKKKSKSDEEIILVPEIGMQCAVEEVKDVWYRGLIVDVTESRSVRVIFVDFGKTITVAFDKIRKLHEKFMACPTQAIKVSIADIKPSEDQWTEEAASIIADNFLDKIARMFTFEKNNDCYTVAFYTETEVNIAALLIAKGFGVSTGPRSCGLSEEPEVAEETRKKMRNVRKTKKLRRRKKSKQEIVAKKSNPESPEDPFKMEVKIIRVESPDIIYLADPNNDKTYEKMMADMQIFYNKYESNDSKWEVNDTCVIYSSQNRSFCRGRIIAVDDNQAEVYLYDLSITETVSVSNVQGLNARFWKKPIYAFKVKLAGIHPCGGSSTWPSTSCRILKDLCEENLSSKFYISKADDETDNLNVHLWIQQSKCDGPLAPSRIETNSVNRILVDNGMALPIKHYNEKTMRILATELKQQISHKSKEEKTENASCIKNPKFKGKECGSDKDSKCNFDTDEESVLSEENKMGKEEEETNNRMLEEPASLETPQSDEDSTESSNDSSDLDLTEEKPTEWLPAEPILDDVFTAIPTNLDHSCNLYLHSVNQNGPILRHIESTLENKYWNMKSKKRDYVWKEGDLCIAQYHGNKKWYRGQVRRILDNDMIEVEFIDYGNIEECENGTLRKSLSLLDVPRQGTKCEIYGLLPNNKSGEWNICDLDQIHAQLIDQTCEISVIKREPNLLSVSIVVTNPRRCELIEFLRNDLHLNVRSDCTNFQFSNDEDEGMTEEDDNVIIEGYIDDYELDEELCSYMNNDNEEVTNDNEKNDETENQRNEDCDEKIEERETESCNDCNGEYIATESSTKMEFPVVASNDDSEELLSSNDKENSAVDDPTIISSSENIISGTINFSSSVDDVENAESNVINQSDCVSIADTINSNYNEEFNSTGCESLIEANVFQWKSVQIPEDIRVVKAEVAKIGYDALFMHLLDNEKSKILSDQYRLYEQVMEDMQNQADEQPLLENVEKGTACCAKFTDDKWYRCEVLDWEFNSHLQEMMIKVVFVDFGNEAYVCSDKIRRFKDEWFEAPCMALWCRLWKIKVIEADDYSEICDKILHVYQSEFYFYVKIQRQFGGFYDVEIYKDEKCTELAYESLIEEGLYTEVKNLK